MPTPTLVTAQPQGRAGSDPAPLIPFVRASTQQTLQAPLDVSLAVTGSSRQVNIMEVPATGYLRGIQIVAQASGGAAGLATVAADADAPWNAIESVTLTDPAGNPIFGPVSGYDLFLMNYFGGYGFGVLPTNLPAYTAVDSDGDFSFQLRIPVEASERDGYAALPNQDSSAAYRLTIVQAASSSIYNTAPDTLPTVRWRAWAEVWTQPTATSVDGRAQQTAPPGLGTTQFTTREINSLVSGNNSLRVKRVGNLIRTLIFVSRDTSGDRMANTNLPDPVRIMWDNLVLFDEGQLIRRGYMAERYGVAASSLPAGVLVYDFTHDLDGKPGGEMRNGLLKTTPATRLEIQGSWGAAGSLQVLVNDIQPVGLA